MRYYNEEEKLMNEAVPSIIRDGTQTITKKELIELQEYFKDRKFVLDILLPKELFVFSKYCGINDGQKATLAQLSAEMGVSRERVRQLFAGALRRLRNPSILKLYKNLTDADVGYYEENYTYDESKISEIYIKKIKTINAKRKNSLTEEEKEADFILNEILKQDVNIVNKDTLDKLNLIRKTNNNRFSYNEILFYDIRQLKENNLQEIVDKIHAIGLYFYCETEYQETWENLSRIGLIRFGLTKLKGRFDIQQQEECKKHITMLDEEITYLDLSTRTYSVLRQAGVETVAELIAKSENDLIRVHNMTKKLLNEIISKVHSLGLNIRPEGVDDSKWVEIQRQKLSEKNSQITKV